MPPLEMKKYLYDIKQACEKLVMFLDGKTIVEYKSEPMLRSAVERQFTIIGEALNQMSKTYPENVARINDHKRIIAFRNRLIHGYTDIDDDVVWGVLEENLHRLIADVDSLMEE